MQKFSKEELKQRLTPLQYKVTQQGETQPAYKNEYCDTKIEGVYNCIVCDYPLFSSEDKFDSGCGWPAFSDQLKQANIKKINDNSKGVGKVEVRCSQCDSHLGHIFKRVSTDKKGVRYCINSASINLKENK